ncbi:MAG: hypothetical protein SFU57_00215 [Gemmatimonadales bacterium]|nr:hypothetical protein [Gemmatimonadales bacterium]
MTGAAWYDGLSGDRSLRPLFRRLEADVTAEVARGTIRTPITDRWRQRGASARDALWRASCWELAGVESTTTAGRIRGLCIARAIVADARGELVPQEVAA